MNGNKGSSHFWGAGWSFPPTFDSQNKQLRLVVDEDCINQASILIMNTQLGERPMNPQFGSPLQQFVFQHINANTLGQIKQGLSYALLHYEPRIKVENIQLNLESNGQQAQVSTDAVLNIALTYRILHTNTRHNFVYPYVLSEATLMTPKQKGILPGNSPQQGSE